MTNKSNFFVLIVALIALGLSCNVFAGNSTPKPDKREKQVSDVTKFNIDSFVKDIKDLNTKMTQDIIANPQNAAKIVSDYDKRKNTVYDKLEAARKNEHETERLIKTTDASVRAARGYLHWRRGAVSRHDDQETIISENADNWEYVAKSHTVKKTSNSGDSDAPTITEKNNGVIVKQHVKGPRYDRTDTGHNWQDLCITATFKRPSKFINVQVNSDMTILRKRINAALGL